MQTIDAWSQPSTKIAITLIIHSSIYAGRFECIIQYYLNVYVGLSFIIKIFDG